ncbi:hypothetical protein JCM10908_000881 [Rhodotorula pacifica]|uniref:uncharacterized protein n=1 Tax=Rhodotorula pacifica TaxID=1495444 RepID=UPI003172A03F
MSAAAPTDIAAHLDPLAARDYLSSLPTELLNRIFSDAWADRRPSGPLNRALCPFYDRYQWRSVRINSPARLARFLQITDKRPGLGLHCEEVNVKLQPEELDKRAIVALLARLPNLKTLTVDDLADTALSYLLTDDSALPNTLRQLTIVCSTGTLQDPYHPSRWSWLTRFGHLQSLVLDLRSPNIPTGRIKSKTVVAWPAIESLAIGLPQKGRSSVLQLIPSFPNLKHLALHSSSTSPDFAGAFDAVQELGTLQSLKLVADPKKGWSLPSAFKQRFELGEDSDFPLDPFLAAMQNNALPQLHTLHFDHLQGMEGSKDRGGREVWKWEDAIRLIRRDIKTWRRAKWTEHFSHDTFKDLRNLYLRRKIDITGKITSAIEVEHELADMEAEIEELEDMISSRGSGAYAGINSQFSGLDDHGCGTYRF